MDEVNMNGSFEKKNPIIRNDDSVETPNETESERNSTDNFQIEHPDFKQLQDYGQSKILSPLAAYRSTDNDILSQKHFSKNKI